MNPCIQRSIRFGRFCRFTVGLAFFALLVSSSFARDKKMKNGTLFVDAGETLQIVFSPRVPLELSQESPSVVARMEKEQTEVFRASLTPLLEIAALPLECVYLDDIDKSEEGSAVLRCVPSRWETPLTGEFEPIVEVWLHANGFRQRVGVYKGRVKIPISQPSSLRISSQIKEMTTALTPLLNDLKEHIRSDKSEG